MSDEKRDGRESGEKSSGHHFGGRCRDVAHSHLARNSAVLHGLRDAEKLARAAAKVVKA